MLNKPIAELGGKSLSEGDIKDMDLATKFLARRLRLNAAKYRDALQEAGALKKFEGLTAAAAWEEHKKTTAGATAAFAEDFRHGKVGTDSPAFQALPQWKQEALVSMKEAQEAKAEAAAKSAANSSAISGAVTQVRALPRPFSPLRRAALTPRARHRRWPSARPAASWRHARSLVVCAMCATGRRRPPAS